MKMLKRLGAFLLVMALVLSFVPSVSLRAYAEKLEVTDKDPSNEVEDDFFDGVDRVVTGIKVGGSPKTEYYVGEELDTSGLEIVVTYSDDTTKVVTEGFEVTGFDSATPGQKTLTVICKGMTATYEVSVIEKIEIVDIAVTGTPKTEYLVGEELDTTNLILTVIYSNEDIVEVTEGFVVTGFDSTTAGVKTITVTYEGFETTYDITVTEPAPEIVQIELTTEPQTEYLVGDNMESLTLRVWYSDGTYIDKLSEEYTVTGFDTTTAGVKTVTISFEGHEISYEITVTEPAPEKVLTGIEITTKPSKLTYTVGAALSTNGMVVTATYSDGSTETVADYTVTGFDSATTGVKTITVTYEGFTATYDVEVVLTISISLTVGNAESGLALSWPAVEDATAYKIYRRTYTDNVAGEWELIAEVADVNYLDTTAANGVKYGYAVSAIVGEAESEKCTEATAIYMEVVNVLVDNTPSGLKIRWTANAAATKYFIYRSEMVDGVWTEWKQLKSHADLANTSYTDLTAKNGVMYRYCVRALKGSTQYSAYTDGTQIMRLTLPALSASSQPGGVLLTWKANTAAVTYEIYRSAYDEAGASTPWGKPYAIVEAGTLEYLDTAAENGVKYRYTVRVRNGEYISGYKDSAKLFYLTRSATESIVETASGINLTWEYNSAASKYYVYRSERVAGETTWGKWTRIKITANGSEVSYVDTTAVAGNTYRYRITTVKGTDQSSAFTSDPIMKLNNTALSLAAGTGYVNVTIKANARATSYTLQRRVSGGEWETLVENTTTLTYKDTTVESGVTYEYRANANNGTFTCLSKAYSVTAK